MISVDEDWGDVVELSVEELEPVVDVLLVDAGLVLLDKLLSELVDDVAVLGEVVPLWLDSLVLVEVVAEPVVP